MVNQNTVVNNDLKQTTGQITKQLENNRTNKIDKPRQMYLKLTWLFI